VPPSLFFSEQWCRAWESNPHEENPHGILSPERLPFRQPGTLAVTQNLSSSLLQNNHFRSRQLRSSGVSSGVSWLPCWRIQSLYGR
jgi:hypothetical protein